MSDDAAPMNGQPKPRGAGTPLWAKLLVTLSVALMIGGLVLPVLSGAEPRGPVVGVSALSADNGPTPQEAEYPVWHSAMFRMGFSCFVGFVVAFTLRVFLKIAVLAAGFMALLLFGLQHAGLVEVKWNLIAERYDTVWAWGSGQVESVTAFVNGALPSAGAAAVGMFAGLRRRA
ncbi:MAG: FUN14 domain-containing protein [Phycisphaeraceae bacterium]|nr:FUN14 domain-containing protein [Phycisphaeraceae bacterium]